MKGILILLLTIIVCCGNLYAQKSKKQEKTSQDKLKDLSPQARHDAYIQMANNQKLLGWFAVGLGGSMIIGGSAKMMSQSFKDVSKTDIRLLWLPVTGALIGVGGYFIVNKSKEKRKKAALILSQESAYIGHPQHLPQLSYPSVGIGIKIR
jgi:hypothetical protein